MRKKSLFFLFSLCIMLPALSQEVISEQHRIDVATTDGIKPLTDVGGLNMYIYNPGITTDITTLADTSGIDGVGVDSSDIEAIYSVDGRQLSAPQRGVNIVRLSDGTVNKVYIK